MAKNRLPKGLHIVHNIFGEYVVCRSNNVFNFNNEIVDSGSTEKEAIENYFDFVKRHKIKKEVDVEEVKKKIKSLIRKYRKQWNVERESAALGQADGLEEALELLNKI